MIGIRTLCILFLAASASRAAELSTYDGKKATGELLSADAKEILFKSAAGNESFEPSKVSAIDYRTPLEPSQGSSWIEVQLVDGSVFHCSEVHVKGKQVDLTLVSNNKDKPVKVSFPLTAMFSLIRDYQDLKIAQQFRNILAKRGKRDVYIFSIGATLDRVDGTFGEADETGEKIAFDREDGGKDQIAVKRVIGMILNPPPTEIAQTLCRVLDANKNEIYVKSIAVAPDQKIAFTTTTGVVIEYPSTDALAKIDFSVGALSFLSNLEPKKLGGTENRFSRDGLLDKTELKLGEQKYLKGLAIWAGTVLTYDIEGKYKTFEAVAGVDANASESILNDVSVILTIEADNKVVYKQKIQKSDAGRNVNLNVVGVKSIRITVESDGLLDFGNQIDLADAKLRK